MKNRKEILHAIDWYKNKFVEFENSLNGEKGKFVHGIRRESIGQLEDLGFPTLKNELWKYTNIFPIIKNNFNPVFGTNEKPAWAEKYFWEGVDSAKLLFYNGALAEKHNCEFETSKGIIVESLKTAITKYPEIVEKYLGKNLKITSGFDVINSSFLYDGLFVYIPQNVAVEKTIQVLFYTDAENGFANYRNLVVAGENASAKIIFDYIGESGKKYFVNTVNEITLAENSNLKFFTIQSESPEAYHITKSETELKDSASLKNFSFSFGGKISREEIYSRLDGENVSSSLFGLYFGKAEQHIDNTTFIDHLKPNSFSEEFYKGILNEKAHGVFSGKILVEQDAQKTNAYQSNKTILLSEEAEIDTKPQLEIYADDVKCSHGATVGRLDDLQFFYLLSRGVPKQKARSMLIQAFANDILLKVESKEIKKILSEKISQHLAEIN